MKTLQEQVNPAAPLLAGALCVCQDRFSVPRKSKDANSCGMTPESSFEDRNGDVKIDQIRELTDTLCRHLTFKVACGEVKMSKLTEPLEPGGWYLGLIKVISTQVEILKGGQLEKRRIETAALQATIPQIKPCHTAIGITTADAFPQATVLANLP
uniref:Uncharacterized protein n=1 Tax=Oryza punctata TaxID=4537 RepID=A0A0E0JEE0_ORYPU